MPLKGCERWSEKRSGKGFSPWVLEGESGMSSAVAFLTNLARSCKTPANERWSLQSYLLLKHVLKLCVQRGLFKLHTLTKKDDFF